jgi:hypothetical protein
MVRAVHSSGHRYSERQGVRTVKFGQIDQYLPENMDPFSLLIVRRLS